MKSLTRRSFLTTSGLGAGLGLVAAGSSRALAQGGTSTFIISNFNGTPISGGDWIWFNSVAKVKGLGPGNTMIGFMSSIQFTVGGMDITVPVPAETVSFSVVP